MLTVSNKFILFFVIYTNSCARVDGFEPGAFAKKIKVLFIELLKLGFTIID